MKNSETRLMQELTLRKISEYLKRSDAVIVPIGSSEGHGALLPEGTDTFVVDAVAMRLAEKIDALIAPTIAYTYTGGTRNFKGSISLPGDLVSRFVESILLELIRNGFRRIYVLQWHAPYYAHQQMTREIFEKTNVPVVFCGLLSIPAVMQIRQEKLTNGCLETSVVSAALEMMGKSHLLDTSVEPKDQETQSRPEDKYLESFGKIGATVGHFYNHESQHVAFKKELHKEIGYEIIDAMVDAIAGTSEDLKKYIDMLD